jgi:hypothetical protein
MSWIRNPAYVYPNPVAYVSKLTFFFTGQPRPEEKTAHGVRMLNERALALEYANLGRRDYCDRMVRIQHTKF